MSRVLITHSMYAQLLFRFVAKIFAGDAQGEGWQDKEHCREKHFKQDRILAWLKGDIYYS
ncbi:hypothetical protein EOL96_09555 [Candidatus Saccharibacteria bacterium]|nr:hypothetical protein [Candidatus Saccharibacteria bacterium]